MSLTLPDDLTWVLNLLGFMWPQADEDKLRACAQAWRAFGAEVVRINQDAGLVAAQVTAENTSESIDAFERYWHGVGGRGGDFDRAKEAADHMATALDGMATLVEGVKIAIIAQLGLLAAEIIADQLAAPETLGLSEGVAAGEILITRGILRRIIRDGIQQVGREIVQQLKGRVLALFRKILATALRRAVAGAVVGGGADLAKQELDVNVFHSRTHVDLTEVAGAAGTGAILGAVAPGARKSHRGGLRGEANTPLSPVGSNVHPHVRPYPGKGQTSGVLNVKGTEIPLISKRDGPGEWFEHNFPHGPGTGNNATIALHVEGHAAAVMHKHGLKDADLFINQEPCDRSAMCRFNLHKILPKGSILRVHMPGDNGTVKTWVFRQGAPRWTEL
jgi:hypothetical protein